MYRVLILFIKVQKKTGIYKNKNGNLVQFPSLNKKTQFDDLLQRDHITMVASRSHFSPEVKSFINRFSNVTLKLLGSSLKFMLLLENQADIYARLGPTMEWDMAASHAILNVSNRGMYHTDFKSELIYNKPDLTSPHFLAF